MRVFTAVTLALLAMACYSERRAGRGAATGMGLGDSTAMSAAADSLALTLVLPSRVRAGERVPLMLELENRRPLPLDLYLRGRSITFDVVVTRADGELIWRRLEGEVIPAIVHLRTLAAGERLELEAVWDQRTNRGSPLEPGEYAARGLLLVEGEPLATPPVAFRAVAHGR